MKFTYFKFENFKGIGKEILDLSKNPDSKVYTLVGLNESGKTTILEAINYFAYKPESLEPLNFDSYSVEDIHSLIPINKRDNFNGFIIIEAGIEFDEEDMQEIKKVFKANNVKLTSESNKISYTQKYFFKNSIHQPENDKKLWTYDFQGIVGKKGRISRKLNNEEALRVNDIIKQRLPSILYFPNFLFQFPDRIYLESTDKKHIFYKTIIQDILDSLDNDTNVEDHLVNRIKSSNDNEQRNLTILKGKMQKKLTTVIFGKWKQILNKSIEVAEIILEHGIDENGTYLEFNIKDDVDTYQIGERSLGFRWFFVYIFLTQFRTFRKIHKNPFFLFDEPASNLHPSAQLELLKSFEKLNKVIYTTHSHYLINAKWLENTFVIKNDAIDYDQEEEYSSKNTNIKISKYRDFASQNPNQTNYFQPILEVLDYRPSNLELVPNVILTEGKNDFYILKYYEEIIKGIEPERSLKLVPGLSSSKLDNLISLYLGWGANFIILLDSDEAGIKEKNRYVELFGLSLNERIFNYVDIDPKWNNHEIEDLFTSEDKLKIQNINYRDVSKFNKKLFNRSVQELYINSTSIELSSKSIGNLEITIKFLKEKLK